MARLIEILPLIALAARTHAQGYMANCTYGAYIDHGEAKDQFQAVCYAMPIKEMVNTEIDLNLCIANDDGLLNWRSNGGAFTSCKSCASQQGSANMVKCLCHARDDAWTSTNIDLNDGLRVTDKGAIACFEHIGNVSDAGGVSGGIVKRGRSKQHLG